MSTYGSSDDAHLVLAEALAAARDQATHARGLALAAPSCVAVTSASGPAILADQQVGEVITAADRLAVDIERLRLVTRWAGAAYSNAESFVHSQIDALSDTLASILGTLLRPLVLQTLLTTGLGVGAAAVFSWALDKVLTNPVTGPLLQQLIAPTQSLLDSAWQALQAAFGPYLGNLLMAAIENPAVLDLAGTAVGGVDDFILSVLGIPQGGDDMAGIETLLALILPIAANGSRLGANPVTPRQVSQVAHKAKAGPTPIAGYAEGFEQIVSQADDIVIIEYAMPDGTTRYQVFVQGTQNWTMGDEESGFDMLSNLENAGSASELYGTAYGLEQAMLDAGIQPGDAVDLFGYSQGGMATALVAGNGTFNVVSLTTYGAPTGWAQVPEDVNWTQIQLAEDIVPNVAGGAQLSNSGTLIEIDSIVPADTPIGYHLADAYRPSLEWLESSGDTASLAQMREREVDLVGAVAVESTSYELDR